MPSASIRRAAGRIAAVLIALVATLAVTPTKPAEAASLTFMQINICGNADQCGGLFNNPNPYLGSDAAGVDIANSVINASPRPDAVSINELCLNQLQAARNHLASHGLQYQAVWVKNLWAGHSSLEPQCNGFGNGLLIRHTSSSNPADTADRRCAYNGSAVSPLSSAPDSCPSTTSGDMRSQVCARVVTPSYYFCTLHVQSGSDASKTTRRTQEIGIFHPPVQNLINAGKHVVVGGDFNMSPSDPLLDRYYTSEYTVTFNGTKSGYGSFREVDGSCYQRPSTAGSNGCNDPTHGGQKLDYLFVSRPGFSVTGGKVTSAARSDHDLLWGYVGTNF